MCELSKLVQTPLHLQRNPQSTHLWYKSTISVKTMVANLCTKLLWCIACKPLATSQAMFSRIPCLSMFSWSVRWLRRYDFTSPYRQHISHKPWRCTIVYQNCKPYNCLGCTEIDKYEKWKQTVKHFKQFSINGEWCNLRYWHQRAGPKETMTLPPGAGGGWKEGWNQWVISQTVDWMTGRSFSPWKTHAT